MTDKPVWHTLEYKGETYEFRELLDREIESGEIDGELIQKVDDDGE